MSSEQLNLFNRWITKIDGRFLYLNGQVRQIEYNNGNKVWLNENGLYYRKDGPAIIWKEGNKYWYQGTSGALHREDGPAVEYPDGEKCWYLNDIRLTEEEFNIRIERDRVIKRDKNRRADLLYLSNKGT